MLVRRISSAQGSPRANFSLSSLPPATAKQSKNMHTNKNKAEDTRWARRLPDSSVDAIHVPEALVHRLLSQAFHHLHDGGESQRFSVGNSKRVQTRSVRENYKITDGKCAAARSKMGRCVKTTNNTAPPAKHAVNQQTAVGRNKKLASKSQKDRSLAKRQPKSQTGEDMRRGALQTGGESNNGRIDS